MKYLKNAALAATTLHLVTGSMAFADEALLGYISPIASQPNQQITVNAIEQNATPLGWTVRMLDSNLSPDRQVAHIDTLLTLGAKAIAVEALDPNAIVGAIANATSQQVPVIGLNSSSEGMNSTVWWDHIACRDGLAYQELAEYISSRRPDAKVVMMAGPNVPALRASSDCFRKAAETAGLTVIDQVDNLKDSSANAATLAADELVRFPDANVFWAYNDVSALGISAAVQASGKTTYAEATSDGVMIFGINGDADAIAAVGEGRITGTLDPDPYATGLATFIAMKRAIDAGGAPQEDLIVKGTLFTSENIADYVPSAERGHTVDNVPLVE